MELRNLNTFLQVVESGSFSRAAEILGYTQSAVSMQINVLENELNCRLFDRINHTIVLTEQGRKLVLHAQEVRHSIQGLTEAFQSEEQPVGLVRMASCDSIYEKMMRLSYHDFYQQYPGITLICKTGEPSEMLESLSHNETDFVLTLDSRVSDKEYVIAKESKVPLHFVTSPESPLAGRRHIAVEELMAYPFILTEKGITYRRILDQKLAEHSLEVTPVMESGRTDILSRCAEKGQFITVLPDFATEMQVQAGKLVRLDVDEFDLEIWQQLIYHRNKWISRAQEAFMKFIMEHEQMW